MRMNVSIPAYAAHFLSCFLFHCNFTLPLLQHFLHTASGSSAFIYLHLHGQMWASSCIGELTWANGATCYVAHLGEKKNGLKKPKNKLMFSGTSRFMRSVWPTYEWAEISEVSTFIRAGTEQCQGDSATTQLWALWTVLKSPLVAGGCCFLAGVFSPSSLCAFESSVLGHADSLRGLMQYWLKGKTELWSVHCARLHRSSALTTVTQLWDEHTSVSEL